MCLQGRDMHSAKALIAFDANAQLVNNYGETPLDMARKKGLQEMYDLLHLSCLSGSSEMGSYVIQNLHPGEFCQFRLPMQALSFYRPVCDVKHLSRTWTDWS